MNSNNPLDFEKLKLKNMNQIAHELETLEKSLNRCIDITSSSIKNPRLNNYYEDLKKENLTTYQKTARDIEMNMDITKQQIKQLEEEEEEKEEE